MNYINKLDDFIGKKEVKQNLLVYINACSLLKKPLEHCLINGLPGTGKTTLAKIIANELNTNIRIAQGPMIVKPIDITNLLLSLNQGEVLFIDEIHAINSVCFEMLYSTMEEFYIDIVIGKDFNCKVTRIKIPEFTLIGATTTLGKIPQPLEDRFGINISLSEYNEKEMAKIIKFYLSKNQLKLSNEDIEEIIKNSKGIPRVASKLVRRIKDFKIWNKDMKISEIMKKLGYIAFGCNIQDYDYLTFLKKTDRPVGLKTISQGTNVDELTISFKIEPFLLRQGYIIKTTSGRKISLLGSNLVQKLKKEAKITL